MIDLKNQERENCSSLAHSLDKQTKEIMASDSVQVSAKKAAAGVPIEIDLGALQRGLTVGDITKRLAERESITDLSAVNLICKGKQLKDAALSLQGVLDLIGDSSGATLNLVYLVRKSAGTSSTAASSSSGAAASSSTTTAAPAVPHSSTTTSGSGTRTLLLIRHGQCCREGEADVLKELTSFGHKQAVQTAELVHEKIVKQLPNRDDPNKQLTALLYSSSRRATQTALKLTESDKLPDITTWNADILRETDPASNPMRAEEAYGRLFEPNLNSDGTPGPDLTLVVVAHNNIILYFLMRAAGIDMERAAKAWKMFTLRHASITKIEIIPHDTFIDDLGRKSGLKRIVSVGAAGHISDGVMTWENIKGPDLSLETGDGPIRKKLSGRSVIMVCAPSEDDASTEEHAAKKQKISMQELHNRVEQTAAHLKLLSSFMVSGQNLSVVSTNSLASTAHVIAQRFRGINPQIMPDSVVEHPEGAFLQFFGIPPTDNKARETVILIAPKKPLIYCLMRALYFEQEEAMKLVAAGTYGAIGSLSLTVVNVRADSSKKVLTVGDCGHLN
ncbi:unnamed protein product [Amoebophrya sp. A25]|nr:unnamed protein product [Amoebophrya sp. A25]|eukprot:GSA25T00000727001.1